MAGFAALGCIFKVIFYLSTLVVVDQEISRAVAVVPLTALAVAGATLFPSEFKVLQSAVTDKVRIHLTRCIY